MKTRIQVFPTAFNVFWKELKKLYHQDASLMEKCKLSHVPVMCKEVVNHMNPQKQNLIIDMTFGAGGHSMALLKLVPSLKIICLDRDPESYNLALSLSEVFPGQIIPCLGKFSELPNILSKLGIKKDSVDGILFDFGCSSLQFDCPNRGFSISKDGPLDMRMDKDRFPNTPAAGDVINHATEEDLAKIFKIYGEEKKAKKISRAIVESRYTCKPIRSTHDLADLVATAFDGEYRRDKLSRPSHMATKIFQALRIFINNELNEIDYGMLLAHKYLKVGGRLVAISFHSLEDTIVKRHLTGNLINNSVNPLSLKYSAHDTYYDFETLEKFKNQNWLPVNKHVITPSEEEVFNNPRSRSAKLRAAVKIS